MLQAADSLLAKKTTLLTDRQAKCPTDGRTNGQRKTNRLIRKDVFTGVSYKWTKSGLDCQQTRPGRVGVRQDRGPSTELAG